MFSYFYYNTKISSEISKEYRVCNSTSGSFCYSRSVNDREPHLSLSSSLNLRFLLHSSSSQGNMNVDRHLPPSQQNLGHPQLRKATIKGKTEMDKIVNRVSSPQNKQWLIFILPHLCLRYPVKGWFSVPKRPKRNLQTPLLRNVCCQTNVKDI